MHRNSARNAGFTLTELLVASAIFLILMTALVTLFNAAVTSARQGYASIDAGETGRQANMVISRDLVSSFTAREHGDVYNFYGRHDGFMFVGALDNGQIGRVTYVTHPIVGTRPVRTTVREKWGVVEDNIRRQVERNARDLGYHGAAVTRYADEAVNLVNSEYPFSGNDWVDFEVEVDIESLIRYEESGVNDLDTFNMYVKDDPDNSVPPIVLEWPYVDPIEPGRDATVANPDGSAQQFFLLGALDPTPGNSAHDMRALYNDINVDRGGIPHPTLGRVYLRALGRDAFDQMLKARKREFWVRMLSGEQMGIPSLAPAPGYGSVGYWHDEGFNVGNNWNMRVVNEYVVAEGIVARTRLLVPGTDNYIRYTDGAVDLYPDILDAEVRFAYGDGETAPVNYFNDLENFRNPDDPHGAGGGPLNVKALLTQTVAGYSDENLVEADLALADAMVGSATRVVRDPNDALKTVTVANRALLGSPLRPRIPQVVTTDFWVTRTRTRPGAPDIIKRFTQTIQIPAAHGRSVSTTVARGPGASL